MEMKGIIEIKLNIILASYESGETHNIRGQEHW